MLHVACSRLQLTDIAGRAELGWGYVGGSRMRDAKVYGKLKEEWDLSDLLALRGCSQFTCR
jgi:hypothetical protein